MAVRSGVFSGDGGIGEAVMGAYAYKVCDRLIPVWAEESVPDYDGTADYNGDLWYAAAAYIQDLERQLLAGGMDDRTRSWIKRRSE